MALEKDAAKIIKKLGFPSLETASTPASILPKAQACLTRRLGTMDGCEDELRASVAEMVKKGKTTVTLEKTFGV